MANQNAGGAAGAGVIYGLGWIGALVYYINTADGLGEGAIGVLKSLVWPALVVYELMQFLEM